MKVEINRDNGFCIVTADKGDKKLSAHRGSWGSTESQLLYRVKNILNEAGYDLIKKRMWKDGHLVDETALYLRPRNPKNPKVNIAIFNDQGAIYDAGERYNEDGKVVLRVVNDFFTKFTKKEILQERLEYLRSQIEAECISTGEIIELQSLVDHIDPGDTLLLEWAGVKEGKIPCRTN